MSWNIDWLRYIPLSEEGCLLETKGPSTKPNRDPECIICLDEIDAHEDSLTHTSCSHVAHEKCLGKWLMNQNEMAFASIGKCPMCRQPYSLLERVDQFSGKLVFDMRKVMFKHVETFLGHFDILFDLTAAVSDRKAFILSVFGPDYMNNYGKSIVDWYCAEVLPILENTFEDLLQVIKADAVAGLKSGKPWLAEDQRGGVLWDMTLTSRLAVSEHILVAFQNVNGPIQLHASRIATAAARFEGRIANGEDRELVKTELKAMTEAAIADVKRLYLDLANRQFESTQCVRESLLMDQQREYFQRTGNWTPPAEDVVAAAEEAGT